MAPDLTAGAALAGAGASSLGAGVGSAGASAGSASASATRAPATSAPGAAAVGEILSVGTRASGGGRIEPLGAPRPGEPVLRWMSRASTIDEIEKELVRIWAQPNLLVESDTERRARHVAARTSVMNLVIIAEGPETADRASDAIGHLTGRHPSRTLIVQPTDPDGPPWMDARIEAHCVLPRADAPETCSELIHLAAGGETGRHLNAVVAPLLVHDLPVTLWWPGEPPLETELVDELLDSTDRFLVDGSAWSGDGFNRLRQLARLYDLHDRLAIRDFALVRQSRWREAIATVFDLPEFLPYLAHVRRISVTYGTRDETGAPGTTNVIKPLYHVAWLASRLGMRVISPLAPVESKGAAARPRALRPGEKPALHRGLAAKLRSGTTDVGVVIRPVASPMPAGTTLRVEILAERRGSELRADVTAEAENVHVHTWVDGVQALDRTFTAPRRSETDLLGEALEIGGRDPISVESIRMAARLVGYGGASAADDQHPD